MEDEKGSNHGISYSPLSGNAPSETLVSNIGGENDTEKSYEEDGGEIMVEVVGSDVLVNGIGGDQLGAAEVDLGENGEEARTENCSEAMETVNEVQVNTKRPSEVAFAGTRDELNDDRDGVKVSCCESIPLEDDGPASQLPSGKLCALTGESVNPEVVAVDVPSSAEPLIEQIEEVVEMALSLIREEKTDEVKEVYTDSAILDTSVALKRHVESVAETKIDASEKEMMLASNNDVGCHAHMDEDSLVSQAISATPGAQGDAPTAQGEAPAAQSEAPAAQGEAPAAQGEAPAAQGEAPAAQGEAPAAQGEAPAAQGEPGDAFAGEVCILNPIEEGEILANWSPIDEVPKDIAEIAAMEDESCEKVELDGGDGGSEKEEKIPSETSNQSLECQVDAGFLKSDTKVDNIHLLAKGFLDVRATDYREPNVHVGCNIPIVDAEGGPESIVDECGSSQREEQGAVAQLTEPPDHVVVKFGNIKDAAISSDVLNELGEAEDDSRDPSGFCIVDGQNPKTELTNQEEEKESESKHQRGVEVDIRDLGTEEPASKDYNYKLSTEEAEGIIKSTISLRMNQSGYLLPPEYEGKFDVSDLVWGKVSDHLWFPGQIFDKGDASEYAVQYCKEDSYLVAYFGDGTFAWNNASSLESFSLHFSQMENQCSSEAFQNAVNSALDEVSRRVELGLACYCIPRSAYANIKAQVVDSIGIRKESSRRFGVDQSGKASHFEPEKLLEYIRNLAPCPSSVADRLDLVIARAQLSAFCCFKGYRLPTEFPSSGELLKTDVCKGKYPSSDDLRKERSLTELMQDKEYSPDFKEDIDRSVSLSSGTKRQAVDLLDNSSNKKVHINAAEASTPTSETRTETPKPSFKIGECIRKVASQLTGFSPSVKGSNDENVNFPAESSPVNEMLLQLQLVAQDPKKGNKLQASTYAFFFGFVSSIALNSRERNKWSEQAPSGTREEFEFYDVKDSYWTNRVVQNNHEERVVHNGVNGGAVRPLILPFDPAKSVRKPQSRKRFSIGNFLHNAVATEADEAAKRMKQENSPAELILNFAERNCLPSEINLNKTFRRFGPLMESETAIDHESCHARVIFKQGSDAEVACNSAGIFKIFGPVVVNYQIGYSPVISVKIPPLAITQYQQDDTLAVARW